MKFELKNIGIVEYANIELKGLTVLTGLNDTGKSYINKTIFSVIKTVNESKEQSVYEKDEQIRNLIGPIYSVRRQYLQFSQPQESQQDQVKLQTQYQEVISKIFNGFLNKLPENEIKTIINNYCEPILSDLSIKSVLIPDPLKVNYLKSVEIAKNNYNNILNLLNDFPDDERRNKNYFDKTFITGLFQGLLNNNNIQNKTSAEIKIINGTTEILNVSISENKTQQFKTDIIFPYIDATIIETPIIIQLARFITNTLAFPPNLKKLYSQRLSLPYHYTDLIEKISKYSAPSNIFSDIYNGIKETINGQIVFNQEQNGFIYEKKDGAIIPSFNIASGIKSFGLIQLLLSTGNINNNSILIIDEPEVHLHPSWEIKYAEMIVNLSRMGIPIIISTHSSYFIQALVKYVKEYEIEDMTKFYFGKKGENNMSRFDDVTENLEPIFSALAKPMLEVI